MDQTIGIAEATSSAIEKEKFVPRGTVHSIAREESRKQYNRDFTRMKNYLEKKLQQFDNKGNKQNKRAATKRKIKNNKRRTIPKKPKPHMMRKIKIRQRECK